MTDAPLAIIKKNANEAVHVSLGQFNGHDLLNLRVFYDAGGGEFRPGKQGLALRVERLPELIAALQDAEAEAHRRGLLDRRRAA